MPAPTSAITSAHTTTPGPRPLAWCVGVGAAVALAVGPEVGLGEGGCAVVNTR